MGNESMFRPNSGVETKPSLHKAVKYLQINTSALHCFGCNVGGSTESGLKACSPMVLTEDEIFKRSHHFICLGERE